MSVLEIAIEALDDTGIDPPSSLVAGDLGAQLLALANTTGRDLLVRGDINGGWQALRTEGSFTTVAAQQQVANIKTTFPYLRNFVQNTMWNRDLQKRVIGPVTPQAWQRFKADSLSPATELWYLRGNALYFGTAPTAGQSVYFEYFDKRFASTSDGSTLQTAFEANTDIPRLDDYMFVLGIRWRFLQKKGLEYGEAFRQYEDYVSACVGNDRTSEILNINPNLRSEGWDTQIPDGNWNL